VGKFATEIFSLNSSFPRNALGNASVDWGCRGGECKDYGTDVSEDPFASILYAEDVKQPVLVLHNYQTYKMLDFFPLSAVSLRCSLFSFEELDTLYGYCRQLVG
jgi:hypothetical protein